MELVYKSWDIIHHAGKTNTNTDAFSIYPQSLAPNEGIGENECGKYWTPV